VKHFVTNTLTQFKGDGILWFLTSLILYFVLSQTCGTLKQSSFLTSGGTYAKTWALVIKKTSLLLVKIFGMLVYGKTYQDNLAPEAFMS
jgi:hypothetical protein